jgi:predicted nucleic acid-binding protein
VGKLRLPGSLLCSHRLRTYGLARAPDRRRIVGALAAAEGVDPATVSLSFHHDVMLACTVREHGRVLVTHNAHDFARMQRHLRGLRYTRPFP